MKACLRNCEFFNFVFGCQRKTASVGVLLHLSELVSTSGYRDAGNTSRGPHTELLIIEQAIDFKLASRFNAIAFDIEALLYLRKVPFGFILYLLLQLCLVPSRVYSLHPPA